MIFWRACKRWCSTRPNDDAVLHRPPRPRERPLSTTGANAGASTLCWFAVRSALAARALPDPLSPWGAHLLGSGVALAAARAARDGHLPLHLPRDGAGPRFSHLLCGGVSFHLHSAKDRHVTASGLANGGGHRGAFAHQRAGARRAVGRIAGAVDHLAPGGGWLCSAARPLRRRRPA